MWYDHGTTCKGMVLPKHMPCISACATPERNADREGFAGMVKSRFAKTKSNAHMYDYFAHIMRGPLSVWKGCFCGLERKCWLFTKSFSRQLSDVLIFKVNCTTFRCPGLLEDNLTGVVRVNWCCALVRTFTYFAHKWPVYFSCIHCDTKNTFLILCVTSGNESVAVGQA